MLSLRGLRVHPAILEWKQSHRLYTSARSFSLGSNRNGLVPPGVNRYIGHVTLAARTLVGPYEIIVPIGKGGMGEVYRARDTKLERDVAIKVLPDELASDEDRVARFKREAIVLASLNHPNIASIYGFENGALVLELVEGPTLAERLREGAIPVDEALGIAKQIASALEAGHDAGIVHRDLKPANVKLKDDGTVKVLDYGLAKAYAGDPGSGPDPEISQSPTLTRHSTQVGMILGTAAYMSPEQAKGKNVDRRADIFAFGSLVYEMLTGRRAFPGEDVSETLAYVLTKEPDFEALPGSIPARVDRALRLCLEKDPARRVRDIVDAQLAIEGAFETTTERAVASRPSVPRWWWAAAIALSLVTAAIAWGVARRGDVSLPVSRLSLTLPPDVSLADPGLTHVLAISSDGARVAFATEEGLYLRELDRIDASPIPGTEGAVSPFFSPNGEWIGFWSDGQIKKVPAPEGTAIVVCEAGLPYGAVWDRSGDIVFGQNNGGVLRVSSDGGTPEVLVPARHSDQYFHGPQLLPGARAVLYTLGGWGAWDDGTVVVYSLDTEEHTTLLEGARDARYVSTGHIVYVTGGSLVAVPFDPNTRTLTGGRVPLAERIVTSETTGAAQFSVSDSGTLFYLSGANLSNRRLVWIDREGNEELLAAEPRAYARPSIAPDGRRVAVDVFDADRDIWIWDIDRETLTRLTLDPSQEINPNWMPDGSRVAFSSRRHGVMNLYSQSASGTGEATRLSNSQSTQFLQSVTADGRLVYVEFELVFSDASSRPDIGVLSPDGSMELLLATENEERDAHVSPDNRWMAYVSDASGEPEVYVRPFPNVDDGQWLISRGGGSRPMWSPDGRELFYTAPGSRFMAVRIQTDPEFVPGDAEELFGGVFTRLPGRTYDISPDGKRFLVVKDREDAAATEFVVVMNWFDELERLVP